MKVLQTCFLLLLSTLLIAQNDWVDRKETDDIVKTSQLETPSSFRLIELTNYQQTFNRLLLSPERFIPSDRTDVIIDLPLPNGEMESFRVLAASVMEDGLQRKFPQIRSYTGIGIDNKLSIAKIDFGEHGFHAMIKCPDRSPVYIDPYRIEDATYMAYYKSDYPSPSEKFECGVISDGVELQTDGEKRTATCEFRQYRLALACTGEYAQFHGGTVAAVMSAFNKTMNRVNGVYEVDASVTMVLVANNDLLIYLNGSTDPYTNNNGSAMLGENQSNCDAVIGTANYDVGHVFSTGGGGIASLRAPCNAARKARGVTGLGSPVGDPFDIDYVSHELGHQWGGNHTQNNNCNRSSASYEPGSASTIMGYAGICNPNVQSNSDDHFHAVNVGEMDAFITNSMTGGSCGVVLSSANNPPIADAGLDYHVPAGTPFALEAFGSDPDGDPLMYCWEQYNNEVSPQPPESTSDEGPNFRSNSPTTSPIRELPTGGMANTWEVLSDVSRVFDFRVTLRDFNSTYGYGCTHEDDMTVSIYEEVPPFEITSANGGEVWTAGGSHTVTWNFTGTVAAPFNTVSVNILLSTNGGASYDYLLLSNTANDGIESVTMPAVATTQARLKIEAGENIFFDISDGNFTLQQGNCANDNLVFDTTPIATGDYFANATINASVNVVAGANVLFQANEIFLNENFEVFAGSEFEAVIGACP